MKKIIIALLLGFFIKILSLSAQSNTSTYFGVGAGIDYAGLGVKITAYPIEQIGLFGSFGYLKDIKYCGGVKYRFVSDIPDQDVYPFISASYGYNTAIIISNDPLSIRTFKGWTFGLGLDINASSKKKNYLSIVILLPIRTSNVDNYINDLKINSGVDMNNKLFPIGISIGYNFFAG